MISSKAAAILAFVALIVGVAATNTIRGPLEDHVPDPITVTETVVEERVVTETVEVIKPTLSAECSTYIEALESGNDAAKEIGKSQGTQTNLTQRAGVWINLQDQEELALVNRDQRDLSDSLLASYEKLATTTLDQDALKAACIATI